MVFWSLKPALRAFRGREHPIGATGTLCETLSVQSIAHSVAELSGDFSDLAQASRSVSHLIRDLRVSYPWRYCLACHVAVFEPQADEGHRPLEQLDGGFLAAGTAEGSIKVLRVGLQLIVLLFLPAVSCSWFFKELGKACGTLVA